MGSRQEQPPTNCSPALGAIGVDRRKDRFLGLQVRFGYPNAQGKSIALEGWHGARFTVTVQALGGLRDRLRSVGASMAGR